MGQGDLQGHLQRGERRAKAGQQTEGQYGGFSWRYYTRIDFFCRLAYNISTQKSRMNADFKTELPSGAG